MAFTGVDGIAINENGNLVLSVADGRLVQQAPVIYQDVNGQRIALAGRYVLRGERRVGFAVAAYDTSHTLVIDPVLLYGSYPAARSMIRAAP